VISKGRVRFGDHQNSSKANSRLEACLRSSAAYEESGGAFHVRSRRRLCRAGAESRAAVGMLRYSPKGGQDWQVRWECSGLSRLCDKGVLMAGSEPDLYVLFHIGLVSFEETWSVFAALVNSKYVGFSIHSSVYNVRR
jgi:hypothetical protein